MPEEPTKDELVESYTFFAALLMTIARENGGKRVIDLTSFVPGQLGLSQEGNVVTISSEEGAVN